MKLHPLCAAVAASLLLAACGGGGGGGNIRPDAPPPVTPPPPPPPPVTPPPPAWSVYTGRADNTKVPTGVAQVHAETGITGKGVKVAVLDDQFYENESYAGKTVYLDLTDKPSDTPATSSKRGHGAAVVSVIVGNPFAATNFKGGVAPGATVYWGRMCVETLCYSSYATPLIADFVSKGVNIFNLSVGNSLFDDDASNKMSAEAWARTLKPMLEKDGLAIFSAVNDGKADAGLPAALPVYVPSAKNNIIAAAAATIGADGKPTGLADYSNRCGSSAEWCLVAPGTHNVPSFPGTDSVAGGFSGTSSAAPTITGVAALVSEKYPWMTGNNIQHTLLTTATDMGAPGVDAIYGWGFINAAKAINGPAQFYRTFFANTTGTSTFSNDISGSDGLVKSGDGTLILSGNNTYTGQTDVNGGKLVAGNLAGSVVVNNAIYEARGRVGGDYKVTGNSTTAIQVGKTFQVGGNANISGGLLLLPEASGYSVKAQEKLLQATKVTGQFNNVTYANNFLWSANLAYTDTEVLAAMTRTSAQAQAQSFNLNEGVKAGAGAIDAFIRETDKMAEGKAPVVTSALQTGARLLSLNDAQAIDAFSSVGGEVYAQDRTASVRSASTGVQSQARRVSRIQDSGVWGSVENSQGTIDRAGYSRAQYDKNSVLVGGALKEDAWTLGAEAQAGRQKLDINAVSGHSEATTKEASVFVKRDAENWYATASAGAGRNSVKTRREVILTTPEQLNSTRRDSTTFARVEVGMTTQSGLKPYIAAEQVRHKQGAFTEQGQSGLELASDSNTFKAAFAEVGIRFDKDINAWRFSGDISYQDLISGRYPAFEAWFAQTPNARFMVEGQELSSSTVRAGLQAARKITQNTSVTGGVSFEKSSGRNTVKTGFLGLEYRF